MRFYKNLYVGDTIKNVNRVKWKLKYGAGQFQIYLITLSENPDDQLDIFHNSLLKQKVFRSINFRVVGIATSREEAIEIVQKITNDCIEATNSGNIKDYIIEHF